MVRSGIPAEYGEVLRALTETIASGRGSQPDGDILAATGAGPTSFADFAAMTARAPTAEFERYHRSRRRTGQRQRQDYRHPHDGKVFDRHKLPRHSAW
jgi:hypothetical protein